MIYKLFNPFHEFDLVKTIWVDLLKRSDSSFFTSWEWISTWIASLSRDTDLQLVAGYRNDEPMVAFFIGCRQRKRHSILPTRVMVLNATGNAYFDKLTIEYNSLLFDPKIAEDKDSLFAFLDTLSWDEFVLPGISQEFVSNFNFLEISGRHYPVMIDRVAKSHFVELHKIRDAGMDYLSLLSANKRSQIRRSIKQYEVDAKIQSQQATSAEEALVMLDELARLHEQAWQNRGKTGAFSNKYFFEFHKNLVRNHFCTGSIQLLHIFSEKETIGYLYNFIHHRKVLFYQSGLNYSAGNHYRPGLVSHYYAILHNAVQNMDTYDFLAGDAEYKRSLATDSVPMYWVRLIRSRQRYGLETGSKKIKQAIRTLLKKAKAA